MITYKSRLDSVSILIALLCVVHCIVLPVCLVTFPLWGHEMLENVYIEIGMSMATLFAGGSAILRGYKKFHKRLQVVILFIVGLASMTIANFFQNEGAEMLLKACGATLIITAHVQNFRKCRACDCTKSQ